MVSTDSDKPIRNGISRTISVGKTDRLLMLLVLVVSLLTLAEWAFIFKPQMESKERQQLEALVDLHAVLLSRQLSESSENRPSVGEVRSLVAAMFQPRMSSGSGPFFSSIKVKFYDEWQGHGFYVGELNCSRCETHTTQVYDNDQSQLLATLVYQFKPHATYYWIAIPICWIAQLFLLVVLIRPSVSHSSKQLSELAERYSQVFRHSPIPLVIANKSDCSVVELNQAAKEFWGDVYSCEECFSAFEQKSEEAANTNALFRQARLVDKNGFNRDVMLAMADIGVSGTSCSLFGFIDVSERSKLEAELSSAKEKAETASRSKDSFLAAVSHEVRTPLSGIIGFTELLSKTKLTEQQSEHVRMVDIAARNLAVVIEDILDFSQIESGGVKVTNKPTLVRTLIEEGGSLMEVKADSKQVTILSNVAEDVPPLINTDPHRLRQVLLILLDNAIKYSNGGCVQVEVRALSDISQDRWIEFAVTDSGPGIPKRELQHIFDAFYQVGYNAIDRKGGVGLGLSIAKKLVTALDGSIRVNSVVGNGSRFSFTLPLSEVSQEEFDEIRLSESLGSKTLGEFSALVIDDDKINGTLLQYLLQARGMQAYWVDNAERGLEMIVQSRYDIVFIDLHLPGMNGLELLERVKKEERQGTLRCPPMVVTTADVHPGTRKSTLDKGMDDFLAKPIGDGALGAILERHLKNKG